MTAKGKIFSGTSAHLNEGKPTTNLGRFCRENAQTIVIMLVLALVWVLCFYYFRRDLSPYGFFLSWLYSAAIWISLWMGNSYASNLVTSWISWMEQPLKRLLVGIIVMLVYTLFVVYALVWIFEYLLDFRLGNEFDGMLYSSLIITVVISSFMHARAFFINWKQALLEASQSRHESVMAQYESLKNQVNPHFLFNSLNALTNLVYEDQERAVKFIKQLSDVYRYVLDTHHREVVPLADEVRFLRSYMFLQQIRFGEKLSFEIQLDKVVSDVAPLALQMLVENAIKHNTISASHPLTIRISASEDYLVVENNLQRKPAIPGDSSGLGLKNIIKRYEFLSSATVVVTEANERFVVKLPMIKAL